MSRGVVFDSVRVSGGLLPSGLLERVGRRDSSLEGVSPADYYLASGERLGESITRSWNRLQGLWEHFSTRTLTGDGPLTGPTRQEWLLPLFQELGFGHLASGPGFDVEGKPYPISHVWESIPIHLVGAGVEPGRRTAGVAGAASMSPHGLVQEFLNRSDDHLWGVLSNGLVLRLLRDNASLTRTAFVEFDLRAMFEGELYSDFVVLWLTCHASRLEGPAGKQLLEKWREASQQQGVRALDDIRDGVESAIEALGSEAIGNPANVELRRSLDDGSIDAGDLYRQILRVVYRMLFLLVTESRNLLLDPKAEPAARNRYQNHYSITRLRNLAETTRGGRHSDLWEQFAVISRTLESEGEPSLALLPLGGFLWSRESTAALSGLAISNEAFLEAIASLTTVKPKNELPQRVDYANLGAEELGSIYESLLEYMPEVNAVVGTFLLKTAVGNERKTTGSYYTPTPLINQLLNSALDPVIDEASNAENPEQALLDLKVVDPAAGSGHFLIAAAHRIADRLAKVRLDGDEPSPEQSRTALRDVIGNCIYAVDINPMAIELAKVALWLEAMEPGKPLSFLDHHIVCGNSLLGVTPKLLEESIPDVAYKTLTGDDKGVVKALKDRNRIERKKRLVPLNFGNEPDELLRRAADELKAIDRVDDGSLAGIAEKQRRYQYLISSHHQRHLRLAADGWVGAFTASKTNESPEITTATINAALHDPDSVPVDLASEIEEIAQRFRFHHWHLAFPQVFTGDSNNEQAGWAGGFDVVLGNPPWERVKLQEKEFFANTEPEIATAPNKAARTRLIDALKTENPSLWQAFQEAVHGAEALSHFLRTSGRFPLCGRGDVNTYTVFAEEMRNIAGPRGRVGVIVPTGIATDDTTKDFFVDVTDRCSLVSLYDFRNNPGFFAGIAAAQGVRFSLLTLSGADDPQTEPRFLFRGDSLQDLAEASRTFTLGPDDFALLNPNTKTCPIFMTRRDADITKSIYRRVPVLINDGSDEGNAWGISFLRMFDMSNDSDLFKSREELELNGWTLHGNVLRKEAERFLPLYEAKMIHQFTHRYGDFSMRKSSEDGKGVRALPHISPSVLRDPFYEPLPRYWVHSDVVDERLWGRSDDPFLLAFRGLTAATPDTSRTVIAALMPRFAAGNSLPCILPSVDPEAAICLYANLNSFALDYVARQKIGGTNLNYFVLKQFPVLHPDTFEKRWEWFHGETIGTWVAVRVAELVYSSQTLSPLAQALGIDGPPFPWNEQRRTLLKAEIEAAFFHLYGIARDDLDYIMETFLIVARKDVAENGSYRTKELILDVYDRMANAIETGEPYQTLLDPPPADPSLQRQPRPEGDN